MTPSDLTIFCRGCGLPIEENELFSSVMRHEWVAQTQKYQYKGPYHASCISLTTRLLIVASHYSVARDFAAKLNLTRTEWSYVNRAEQVRGLRGYEITYISDWWNLENVVDIKRLARATGLREVAR